MGKAKRAHRIVLSILCRGNFVAQEIAPYLNMLTNNESGNKDPAETDGRRALDSSWRNGKAINYTVPTNIGVEKHSHLISTSREKDAFIVPRK